MDVLARESEDKVKFAAAMKWCKKKFRLQNWREKVQYGLYMHSYACGLPISQLLLLIHIGAWHHTLHHLPEASKPGTGEDDNEKYAGTPGLHHWKEVHEAPGAVGQYSGCGIPCITFYY